MVEKFKEFVITRYKNKHKGIYVEKVAVITTDRFQYILVGDFEQNLSLINLGFLSDEDVVIVDGPYGKYASWSYTDSQINQKISKGPFSGVNVLKLLLGSIIEFNYVKRNQVWLKDFFTEFYSSVIVGDRKKALYVPAKKEEDIQKLASYVKSMPTKMVNQQIDCSFTRHHIMNNNKNKVKDFHKFVEMLKKIDFTKFNCLDFDRKYVLNISDLDELIFSESAKRLRTLFPHWENFFDELKKENFTLNGFHFNALQNIPQKVPSLMNVEFTYVTDNICEFKCTYHDIQVPQDRIVKIINELKNKIIKTNEKKSQVNYYSHPYEAEGDDIWLDTFGSDAATAYWNCD